MALNEVKQALAKGTANNLFLQLRPLFFQIPPPDVEVLGFFDRDRRKQGEGQVGTFFISTRVDLKWESISKLILNGSSRITLHQRKFDGVSYYVGLKDNAPEPRFAVVLFSNRSLYASIPFEAKSGPSVGKAIEELIAQRKRFPSPLALQLNTLLEDAHGGAVFSFSKGSSSLASWYLSYSNGSSPMTVNMSALTISLALSGTPHASIKIVYQTEKAAVETLRSAEVVRLSLVANAQAGGQNQLGKGVWWNCLVAYLETIKPRNEGNTFYANSEPTKPFPNFDRDLATWIRETAR